MNRHTSSSCSKRYRLLRLSDVALIACVALALNACTGTDNAESSGEYIHIGASLPFSGPESALGRNLEQAMMLAVEDVNKAGGVNGTQLKLVTRDSNSGSDRGQEELLSLLYSGDLKYLIGPEENELATSVVKDIKGVDVLNILPSYAAPSVGRIGTKGAWLRLAPGPFHLACGIAGYAVDDGVTKANALYSPDDYNSQFATQFEYLFRSIGGTALPFVKARPGQDTYESPIKDAFGRGAERTLLIAYPATAARIVTEWAATGKRGSWYMSPLLYNDLFLLNVPDNALNGAKGLSPSLSLRSECESREGFVHGPVKCKRKNAERFAKHFEERWDGEKPFSAAYFYYDAVVLVAQGLKYSIAVDGSVPKPVKLHQVIRSLSQTSNSPAYWYDLDSAMKSLGERKSLRYVGAAAEYEFDELGAAKHRLFDSWTIQKSEFVTGSTFYADCRDKR